MAEPSLHNSSLRACTAALPPRSAGGRREFLRAGALAVAGLSLPTLLAARARGAAPPGKAKSCILLFLEGGPAHQDLWDLKPEAPAEYRGEFRPIGTSLPGVAVCEHLPRLARQMHRVALVRSLHHTVVDHNAGAYYTLTGRTPQDGGRLILADEPGNFPPYGAVLARLRPRNGQLPSFVQLPDIMANNGSDLPGQRAGFLGPAYDPFLAGDPSARGYSVPGLSLPVDVAPARLAERRELLAQFDRRLAGAVDARVSESLDIHYRRAFELMSSPAARQAFDLTREPAAVRAAYGLPDRENRSVEARKFGGLPHLGQCLLLARRLVEAGVPLVTVASGRRFDQAWDTHRDHFPLLAKSLLPYLDQGLSALLSDLADRGLLEETLVVAVGEFGRTPKLGQITSGAGADAAGRDHWPNCYTALLAGGGIWPGAVYGASDRHAAYPARDAVTPEDLAATIYAALGIEPGERIFDALRRPHEVALGEPIRALFAGG